MLLGTHVSSAGKVSKALELAHTIGINALQIQTRRNDRWFETPILPDEVIRFREAAMQFERNYLFARASALINLASPNRHTVERSISALFDELLRAEALGVSWVVLQLGNHEGEGEEGGLRRVMHALKSVLKRTRYFKVGILLETSAGQGSALGYKFDQLAKVRKRVLWPKRIGVCVDTCHIFGAGYDLRDLDSYRNTIAELDRIIGIRNVKLLHLGDSIGPLHSHRSQRMHVGEGCIGLDGFTALMNDERFFGVPKILETPKGSDVLADIKYLAILRSMVGKVRKPCVSRPENMMSEGQYLESTNASTKCRFSPNRTRFKNRTVISRTP